MVRWATIGSFLFWTLVFGVSNLLTATPATASSSCIANGGGYQGLVITPDGRKAYVSVDLSDSLVEIDLTSMSVSRCLDVSSAGTMLFSTNAVLSPDGGRLFVANLSTQNIMVIDTATNAIITLLPILGQWGECLKVSPDSSRLYVVSREGSLKVVNTNDFSTQSIQMAGFYLLGIAPSNTQPNVLYGIAVLNGDQKVFFSFDLTSQSVINQAIVTDQDMPSPTPVRRLLIDSKDEKAYFGWLNFGDLQKGYGKIVEFDLSQFAVTAATDIEMGVHDMALNEAKGKIYTVGFWSGGAASNTLPISEYDLASRSVSRTFVSDPAADSRAIAVDPTDPNTVYFLEGEFSYLGKLDLASGKIIDRIDYINHPISPRAIGAAAGIGYVFSQNSTQVYRLDLSSGGWIGSFSLPDRISGTPGGTMHQGSLYIPDASTIYVVDPGTGKIKNNYGVAGSQTLGKLSFFGDKAVSIDYEPGTMIGRKLYVFNSTNFEVDASWDLPNIPHCDQVIVSPDGLKLYYSSSRFDGLTNITIVNALNFNQTQITVPANPANNAFRGATAFTDAAFNEAARRLYLAGFDAVYVIDMDNDSLVNVLDLVDLNDVLGREFTWTHTGIAAVALSPDNSKLRIVAGDSNLMYTYDLVASGWTADLVNIGGYYPTDAALSPNGAQLYTINLRSDSISRIDLASGRLINSFGLPD